MPHELEVLAFTFQGRAVEYRGTQIPQSVTAASPTQIPQSVTAVSPTQLPQPDTPANGDEDDMTRKTVIADRVMTLNAQSVTIAQDIEDELRSMLPPFTNVRAEVHFSTGSIVMAGTILVLNWAGGLVFKAAKETVEEQISSIVQLAVQRVFTLILSPTNSNLRFQTAEVAVTPQTSTSPEKPGAATSPAPVTPAAASVSSLAPLRWPVVLWVLLALMFLIQIVLLADRFLSIGFK